MVLTHEYEPVRALILHQGSLPTLGGVVSELLYYKMGISILMSQSVDTSMITNSILAITPNTSNL